MLQTQVRKKVIRFFPVSLLTRKQFYVGKYYPKVIFFLI